MRRACSGPRRRLGRRGPFPIAPSAKLRRRVEADRIAVSKALRTLQSWRLSKEEIDEVRAESRPAGPAKRRPTARSCSRSGRGSTWWHRWTA